jgi:hypothetical protein
MAVGASASTSVPAEEGPRKVRLVRETAYSRVEIETVGVVEALGHPSTSAPAVLLPLLLPGRSIQKDKFLGCWARSVLGGRSDMRARDADKMVFKVSGSRRETT